MTSPQLGQSLDDIVASVPWYHTINLGGTLTPGQYDHQPYLPLYGLPSDLTNKTALDIGAASGFFAFELERRGANVTATELPDWFAHDFGPNYVSDQTAESAQVYLHRPIEIAKQALHSSITTKYINIYDIAPDTVGMFDLVFCGSVLIHLTDPIKALWNIARVTREKAILATVIAQGEAERPIAEMVGADSNYCWWVPTRACLELMAVTAGFVGVEWFSDFQLNYRGQSVGPYHGVLHAYTTTDNWTERTLHRDQIIERYRATPPRPEPEAVPSPLASREDEIQRLRALVSAYENGRFMRLMRWLHGLRGRRTS